MTTLRMATQFADGSPEALAIDAWAASIANLSGGVHSVQVFHSGQLVSSFEVMEAVGTGVVDMGWFSPRIGIPELRPLTLGAGGSLGAETSERLFDVLQTVGAPLFALQGMHVLGAAFTNAAMLATADPVALPEDLDNRIVVSSGGLEAGFLSSLGGVTVVLPASEMYFALQAGVIHGVMRPPSTVAGLRLDEVTVTQLAFPDAAAPSLDFAALTINAATWAGLPADLRALLEQETGAGFSAGLGQGFLDSYSADLAALDAASDGFTLASGATLQAWQDAAEAYRDTVAAGLSGPALEILEAFTDGSAGTVGTAGADSLPGTAGDDRIDGLAGDDTLAGFAGDDTLSGGADDDLAYAGPGTDSLSGGLGRDTLYGAGEDDTLSGGPGADLLGGGPGNDMIDGGDGDDAIWTSAGDDTATGGDGNDTLGGAGGNDVLAGDDGDDALWGADGADSLDGGEGDDTLGGADGDDMIDGGSGLGSDELWGGAGNDTLRGDVGFDQLGGGTGNDSLDGGHFADTVSGGLGDDTVLGGTGDDLIFGAAGADSLVGGRGDDTIFAGPGQDTIAYARGDGADVLEFFSVTEDRLQLDDSRWTGTLTPAQVVADFGRTVGADYVLDFGDGDSLTLVGLAGLTGLESQIDIV